MCGAAIPQVATPHTVPPVKLPNLRAPFGCDGPRGAKDDEAEAERNGVVRRVCDERRESDPNGAGAVYNASPIRTVPGPCTTRGRSERCRGCVELAYLG
eukprot:4771326-Prymnesium_polylepis.1